MAGPLIKVKTKTASISLDVNRVLNLGKGKVLNFVVPDTTELTKWRTLLSVTKGFDRMTPSEETRGEGREVIFRVADLNGDVGSVIREKDLHVELDGDTFSVDTVPQLAPNVAQVYNLTCKTRTLRNKYFDNKKS